MPKAKQKESDQAYLLKLILYFLLGGLWLDITNDGQSVLISLPVGFALGLLFARHDHFAIDRKIEYAVLVISMFLSYFLPVGLVLAL